MKQVIKFPFKLLFTLLIYVVTYLGWLIIGRKKSKENDVSWETGRQRIFDFGIDYWENKLQELNLKKDGIDVLEVGSGNGQWLIAFSRFANRVEGVEPGYEIIEYSREKLKEYGVDKKVNVTQSFAEELPFEDKSFDLLFCSGVFMFTNQEKALKEFSRVLRDNGTVVITVNGLGYFMMYLIDGMKYKSVDKTRYGILGILNTFIKWAFKKQIGTCAVSYNEMNKKFNQENFNVVDTRLWLPMDFYSLEHAGFTTNYAFTARKK